MADESKKSIALHHSPTGLTPTTSSLDCNSSNLMPQQTKNLSTILPNGKKTKGRVKIKMEYIENKLRRYTTFSKRKTGIMKKAHELSILTGTQVMLLVASETGHVYAFSTNKLKPMISSEQGKNLIQRCLNSPDDQCIDINGTIKTEFTFEPSTNGCLTPSNPRKRKFIDGDGGSLPTMVISGMGNDLLSNSFVVDEFFCGESDDSYEMENDDDGDENEDENEESVDFPQTSFNSSAIVNKNNNTKIEFTDNNARKSNSDTPKLKSNNTTNNIKQTTNNKPIKWTTSSPQTMLKDALKAAADQRQRQKKLSTNSISAYSNNRTSIGNNSSNNNNTNLLQQQLSALIPIMLQSSNFNINQSTNSSPILNSNQTTETNPNFINKNNLNSNINLINDEKNNTNALQQLLNGGFSFENFSAFQQVLATAALNQLAENSKS